MKEFVKLSVCGNYSGKFEKMVVRKEQIQSVSEKQKGWDDCYGAKSVISITINGQEETLYSDDSLDEVLEILNG